MADAQQPDGNGQSLDVKRAEVEFHRFASLGEPDRAIKVYAEENVRRAALIRNHLAYLQPMSPFLEIGANAGHTSYMLANEFGCHGFALDISADSLRYGRELRRAWGLSREPVRLTGDAQCLPFRDGSLRMVCAFQMLSQFQDVRTVFSEVRRVLAPGGVFLFAEEPLRRRLSLRLYRCPYVETMNAWERKLHQWGLLGYLVRDVIGAHQEESFGIRQNHRMYLRDWEAAIREHFADCRNELFVPERGWAERWPKRMLSNRLAAELLGGTLASVCRKAGPPGTPRNCAGGVDAVLCCPDCRGDLGKQDWGALRCRACGFVAEEEGGVYNLLPSALRAVLYPGARPDIAEFSSPGHENLLLDGWHEVEGVFGNKYRWMGARAGLRLKSVESGARRLRLRGFAHEESFRRGQPVEISVTVNGAPLEPWRLKRVGLFVLEADLEDRPEYEIWIAASPVWTVPSDDRSFSVNFSLCRLIPAGSSLTA